jgi:hypothetical protein
MACWEYRADWVARDKSAAVGKTSVERIAGLEGLHVHHGLLARDSRLAQVPQEYYGCPCRYGKTAMIRVAELERVDHYAQRSLVPMHAIGAIRLISYSILHVGATESLHWGRSAQALTDRK